MFAIMYILRTFSIIFQYSERRVLTVKKLIIFVFLFAFFFLILSVNFLCLVTFLKVAPAFIRLTQLNDVELAFIAADFFHVLIAGASQDWVRGELVGQYLGEDLLKMVEHEKNCPVSYFWNGGILK